MIKYKLKKHILYIKLKVNILGWLRSDLCLVFHPYHLNFSSRTGPPQVSPTISIYTPMTHRSGCASQYPSLVASWKRSSGPCSSCRTESSRISCACSTLRSLRCCSFGPIGDSDKPGNRVADRLSSVTKLSIALGSSQAAAVSSTAQGEYLIDITRFWRTQICCRSSNATGKFVSGFEKSPMREV